MRHETAGMGNAGVDIAGVELAGVENLAPNGTG